MDRLRAPMAILQPPLAPLRALTRITPSFPSISRRTRA